MRILHLSVGLKVTKCVVGPCQWGAWLLQWCMALADCNQVAINCFRRSVFDASSMSHQNQMPNHMTHNAISKLQMNCLTVGGRRRW